MACKILIHVQNWNEKMKIIGSFNDDFDYEVITDLKKYVAKRYKVRIVEEEEDGGGGDSILIAASEPFGVENKEVPLLDNIPQNDQMTGTGGNVSTNRNTIVPEEDGYGTFIPYRDRMVEPKEEITVTNVDDNKTPNTVDVIALIDSETSFAGNEDMELNTENLEACLENVVEIEACSMEENKGEEDATADKSEDVDLIDDTPATLTKRSVKRPRYSIENSKERIECKKCFIKLNPEYRNLNKAKLHAITHTELKRFECPVKGCGHRWVLTNKIKAHIKSMHNGSRLPARKIELTTEEEEQLSEMVKECFPTGLGRKPATRDENPDDQKTRNVNECQKCFLRFRLNHQQYHHAKRHAASHTEIYRFECPVEGCGFKCKSLGGMWHHRHNGEYVSARRIELTIEQSMELERVTRECFPWVGEVKAPKICQVCQSSVPNNVASKFYLKNHALDHIQFMLYRCNQTDCSHETKTRTTMLRHFRKKHGVDITSRDDISIELTDEQKKEIDGMLKKCFPNEDAPEEGEGVPAEQEEEDYVSLVDDEQSSSIVRRSTRFAKRRKYSIDEEDAVENQASKNRKSGGVKCQKCLKVFRFSKCSEAKDHAIAHTELKRFECPVDGCTYKYGILATATSHIKNNHEGANACARSIELTIEQSMELEKVSKECFPGIKEVKAPKICKVCQSSVPNVSTNYYLEKHALQHVNFKLYRCKQTDCQFESKTFQQMATHCRMRHGADSISREDNRIELSEDQEKEVDNILKKCFPDEK